MWADAIKGQRVKVDGPQCGGLYKEDNESIILWSGTDPDAKMGREVFIFTETFVFKSTYYKGYSKLSPKLSDIIILFNLGEADVRPFCPPAVHPLLDTSLGALVCSTG